MGTRYWRVHRRCSSDAWLPFRFSDLGEGKSPDATGTYCTIHRQALMVKIMSDELKSVLNEVITAVNLIKANSLNSCYLLIYAKKLIPNLKLFYFSF